MRKVHSIYNGSVWNAERTEQYVYDGWNVVLVLDDANVTQRKYTWGLDLSGTLHGAGGIGGLLAAVETHGTPTTADDEAYWFLYDANGNVWQVLNGTPDYPTIAARYEYDPYGNVISQPSPYDYDNPIRFSTKWFDTELAGESVGGAVGTSGLGYWGYRYYSPRLGRWASLDPIGEAGGLNLHVFVGNAVTGSSDFLGLWSSTSIWGVASNDHKALTTKAFNAAMNSVGKAGLSAPCLRYMIATLVDANVGQDKGAVNLSNSDPADDLRRHYNRPPEAKTVAEKSLWDKQYAWYCNGEEALFFIDLESSRCHKALEDLGRVSHSYQDFFAHAIARNGSFIAFTASPALWGDPWNRDSFWPSSYPGEHPKTSEPVDKSTTEGKARYTAAYETTRVEFIRFLREWLSVCTCYCNAKK